MHIAIIGGGAAGLCAVRHITAPGSGMTCVVYEQTDNVGGTWVYTDRIGNDRYGLPIHSSMYQNLRTNLPKENMIFPGFPYKQGRSFLTAKEVHNYLLDYADHYSIKDHIKFCHHVTKVSPTETGWVVTALNLESNAETVEHFDAVMVCTGHYSVPDIPDIKGSHLFQGKIMHSHYYRKPEEFIGKTVLVIGGGPSGIDISLDMSKFAKKIYFTHHSPELRKIQFPSNVQQMPDVCEITENKVIYEDNSSCQVDVILLCTGYKYTFPFLTPECGVVVVEDKYVKPFYKHVIHAKNPTFCIVGLVFTTFLFPIFDAQIQLFLRALLGIVQLPTSAEMLDDIAKDVQQKTEAGIKVKNYHQLGPGRVKPYADMLTELSHLPPLPLVLFRIFQNCILDRCNDKADYRDIEYQIIDDIKYTRNGILME